MVVVVVSPALSSGVPSPSRLPSALSSPGALGVVLMEAVVEGTVLLLSSVLAKTMPGNSTTATQTASMLASNRFPICLFLLVKFAGWSAFGIQNC